MVWPAAVQRRDRGVTGRHAEHEQARGAGGTHFRDFRVGDEHVGRRQHAAVSTRPVPDSSNRRCMIRCWLPPAGPHRGLGLAEGRSTGMPSQCGAMADIAQDFHQNLNSFASPDRRSTPEGVLCVGAGGSAPSAGETSTAQVVFGADGRLGCRRRWRIGGTHGQRQPSETLATETRSACSCVTSSVTVRAWLSSAAFASAPCTSCWSMAITRTSDSTVSAATRWPSRQRCLLDRLGKDQIDTVAWPDQSGRTRGGINADGDSAHARSQAPRQGSHGRRVASHRPVRTGSPALETAPHHSAGQRAACFRRIGAHVGPHFGNQESLST